jgi:hypothetical protein
MSCWITPALASKQKSVKTKRIWSYLEKPVDDSTSMQPPHPNGTVITNIISTHRSEF